MSEQYRREGLTVLKESSNDLVDFVFVHGLNGHPLETWTQNAGGDAFCWMKNLPESLRARIMTFGYMAELGSGADNLMGLRQHATSLLRHLRNKRRGLISARPLVFVCHSLGGLIVKQSLILGKTKPGNEAVYSSTKAIFFFGTPHRGARLLDSKMRVAIVEKLAKIARYQIPPNIRAVLEPASNELFNINDDFPDVKRDMIIVNFYEAKKTPSISALVVEREAAMVEYPGAENIALARTHQELVRFPDSEDDTFAFVSETIEDKLFGLFDTHASDEGEKIISFQSDYVERLQFSEASRRLEQISIPHRRTFSWLWDCNTGVRSWAEANNSFLWITGKLGSGKSVLMKEIHSQLEKTCAHETIILPFFFNGRGTDLQKSAKGMLRVFVAGILRQASEVQNAILTAYRMKASVSEIKDGGWEKNDLMKMLLDLLNPQQSRLSIILLVDALDECSDDSSMNLLNYLKGLTQLDNNNVAVKVCVSSRDQFMSLGRNGNTYGLCLHDWTERDIENYVEDKLTGLVPEAEKNVLDEMKGKIIRKADGIFLWVELTLEQLQQAVVSGGTSDQYQQLLFHLPDKITDLYSDILRRIPASFRNERDDLLRIVLCAFQPLTIPQLRLILALNNKKALKSHAAIEKSPSYLKEDSVIGRIIKSRCGGLLEIKQYGKTAVVQFIHQSVKDFFDSGAEIVQTDLSGGHELLARACLQYCSLSELHTLRDNLQRLNISDQSSKANEYWEHYPLSKYAVSFWMRHCSEAEKSGFSQTVELLESFQAFENEVLGVWTDLYRLLKPRNRLPDDTTLFHIAAYYNLADITRNIVSTSSETALSRDTKEHGLAIAAAQNHKDLVEFFIEIGVNVNAIGGDFDTPLAAAAYGGGKEIVMMLLEAGADADLGGSWGYSPLSAAAAQGHDEIVRILLAHGADEYLKLKDSLRLAAASGNEDIVQQLLSAGADPLAWDSLGLNTLFWGVASLSPEVVKLLVEYGADVAARIFPGFTVLHWMSLYGNEHMVKTLIELDADPNSEDRYGATPLHFAASNWQPTVVDVLLGADASPNVSNNQGVTPLHLACAQSGVAQVETLIHAGADMQICDSGGMGIVHFAALNSSADVLGTLLASQEELNIDTTTVDFFDRSSIHLAAEFGCSMSFKLLSRDKTELTKRDRDGRTAAHAAARNKSFQVLQHCLQAGADPLACDDGDRTVLHHLFSKPTHLPRLDLQMGFLMELVKLAKNIELKKALERVDSSVNETAQRGEERAANDAIEKINLLLEYGIDIDAQDHYGNTALHLACWANDDIAIEHLLKRGAKVNLRNSDGILPEMAARTEKARNAVSVNSLNLNSSN